MDAEEQLLPRLFGRFDQEPVLLQDEDKLRQPKALPKAAPATSHSIEVTVHWG
jgi:hypothetical protein